MEASGLMKPQEKTRPLGEDRGLVRINVQMVPAFHISLNYVLYWHKEEKRRIEYGEPQTTDELTIEFIYEGSKEYKLPQTTDGY